MRSSATELSIGIRSSAVVSRCQVCESPQLESVLFLGYLPPVNVMPVIGASPQEQAAYPALWLYCGHCRLVQLGLVVDPRILFPPDYPYTSGTTRILRENFAELYRECQQVIELQHDDLVIDIGSNDGTLLSNFAAGGHRVQGIEPTLVGHQAQEHNIPTLVAFFDREAATQVHTQCGSAKLVTATNVFAHIDKVHEVIEHILMLLADDGVFVSESHYLPSLIDTLQYDTIYHEHLRYYSLHSLQWMLEQHGLSIIHAKRIPTHGGSIRVYAARQGCRQAQPSVRQLLEQEGDTGLERQRIHDFAHRVVLSKLQLQALLCDIKTRGHRVFGIGAPSRASTLVNYVGLDAGIVDCVMETSGSRKIGKYLPGTLIPVLDEALLYEQQPEYALLFAWHISDELIPKLRQKGFRGRFIVPLPTPRVITA